MWLENPLDTFVEDETKWLTKFGKGISWRTISEGTDVVETCGMASAHNQRMLKRHCGKPLSAPHNIIQVYLDAYF